jgi:hypothetical protein
MEDLLFAPAALNRRRSRATRGKLVVLEEAAEVLGRAECALTSF